MQTRHGLRLCEDGPGSARSRALPAMSRVPWDESHRSLHFRCLTPYWETRDDTSVCELPEHSLCICVSVQSALPPSLDSQSVDRLPAACPCFYGHLNMEKVSFVSQPPSTRQGFASCLLCPSLSHGALGQACADTHAQRSRFQAVGSPLEDVHTQHFPTREGSRWH